MNDTIIHPETGLRTESQTVETLVWECRDGVDYTSDRYIVQVFFGSDQYYFETWDLSLGRKLYDGDDLQSAKAAAQADYSARLSYEMDM